MARDGSGSQTSGGDFLLERARGLEFVGNGRIEIFHTSWVGSLPHQVPSLCSVSGSPHCPPILLGDSAGGRTPTPTRIHSLNSQHRTEPVRLGVRIGGHGGGEGDSSLLLFAETAHRERSPVCLPRRTLLGNGPPCEDGVTILAP